VIFKNWSAFGDSACGWPNNKTYKWSDTRKLMEYGLAAYERCNLDDIALDEELICTGSR